MARLSRRLWGGTSLKPAAKEANIVITPYKNLVPSVAFPKEYLTPSTWMLFQICFTTPAWLP